MDKRSDKRIKLAIPCLVYKDNNEYDCMVYDISRSGISFKFSKGVEISGNVEFSFIYGNAFVSGMAQLRNTRYVDDAMICGCKLANIRPYDFVEKVEINAAVHNMVHQNVYYAAS